MNERYESDFQSRLKQMKKMNLSYAVIAVVLINILVHLYGMFIDPSIADRGDLQVYGILQNKEYYRIVTSMFLHADVAHIFNNMFVLFFLGDMLEKEVGHFQILIIYLVAGIGGNLVSLREKMVSFSMIPSVGASGAIFGLDGLLLALVLFAKGKVRNVTLRRTLLMIGLSVYSGYGSGNTDNAAHIGGLITGFIAGMIYCFIVSLIQNGKRRGGSL